MRSVRIGIALVVLFAGAQVALHADEGDRAAFNGDWVGTIAIEGKNQRIDIKISIDHKGVTQYFMDQGAWAAVEPDQETYVYDRNNLVYVWENKGGVWSETQVYSLSLVNGTTLDVQWLRQVNNFKNGGDNETWSLHGGGTLERQ